MGFFTNLFLDCKYLNKKDFFDDFEKPKRQTIRRSLLIFK